MSYIALDNSTKNLPSKFLTAVQEHKIAMQAQYDLMKKLEDQKRTDDEANRASKQAAEEAAKAKRWFG
jgi:hypothetical protein